MGNHQQIGIRNVGTTARGGMEENGTKIGRDTNCSQSHSPRFPPFFRVSQTFPTVSFAKSSHRTHRRKNGENCSTVRHSPPQLLVRMGTAGTGRRTAKQNRDCPGPWSSVNGREVVRRVDKFSQWDRPLVADALRGLGDLDAAVFCGVPLREPTRESVARGSAEARRALGVRAALGGWATAIIRLWDPMCEMSDVLMGGRVRNVDSTFGT